MKIYYYSLLIQLLILSACGEDQQAKSTGFQRDFPVVIDTFGITNPNYSGSDKMPACLSSSLYIPFYLGEPHDTIFLYPNYPGWISQEISEVTQFNRTNPFAGYYTTQPNESKFNYAEETCLEIRVDTSLIVADSYPVFLYNRNKDTISIDIGYCIPLFMEALDSSGHWKPIQERFVYFCGIGLCPFILPPQEIAVTLAPIFKGNYQTQLRLTLGINHSSPFHGSINYSQFEPCHCND